MSNRTRWLVGMAFGLLLLVAFLFPMLVYGNDISLSANGEAENIWQLGIGYHSTDLKAEYFRSAREAVYDWGYEVVATDRVEWMQMQVRMSHRERKDIDLQELSFLSTWRGLGIGLAAILEKAENPQIGWKAKYALERKAAFGTLSTAAEWAYFVDTRQTRWIVSPRLRLPSWHRMSIAVSGRWQRFRDVVDKAGKLECVIEVGE